MKHCGRSRVLGPAPSQVMGWISADMRLVRVLAERSFSAHSHWHIEVSAPLNCEAIDLELNWDSAPSENLAYKPWVNGSAILMRQCKTKYCVPDMSDSPRRLRVCTVLVTINAHSPYHLISDFVG